MLKNPLIKGLLFLLSIPYGFGIWLRNLFYQKQLLKSFDFDIPVIAVGNLSVGGSGKSPHTEYLIRYLNDYLEVATLSRGYGRKTNGFLLADSGKTAAEVGDEPLQFSRKFPDIKVAVGESRAFGISELLGRFPATQVIILDDAFQHRAVKPGLNILLTEFDNPFTQDYLLPLGRLREFRNGYKRADIIVVSKCPPVVSLQTKARITKEINPLPHQRVFFSTYNYHSPYYLFNKNYRISLHTEIDVLLICAIAKTDYLLSYLEPQVRDVHTIEYEDHHSFSRFDLSNLAFRYNKLKENGVVIITTEKDAMRLEMHRDFIIENNLPVFVLPVEVALLFEEEEDFKAAIRSFLLSFKV